MSERDRDLPAASYAALPFPVSFLRREGSVFACKDYYELII